MKILLSIILIVVVLLFFITFYLLVSPLVFVLDSRTHLARVGWNWWLYARWYDEGEGGIIIILPFWKKKIGWPGIISQIGSSSKNHPKTQPKNKRSVPAFMTWSRFRRGLSIDHFMLNIDTDDFIWNAYLYPVFSVLRRLTGHKIEINFMGKREFMMRGRIRLIRMLLPGAAT